MVAMAISADEVCLSTSTAVCEVSIQTPRLTKKGSAVLLWERQGAKGPNTRNRLIQFAYELGVD